MDKAETHRAAVEALRVLEAAESEGRGRMSNRQPIEGQEFVRAWLNLPSLPGGMMVGPNGLFGPVGGTASCLVTCSETERERLERTGQPILEVWLVDPETDHKDIRIATLEARLAEEARVRGLYPYLCPECGGNWNGPELAAHDDRIRRETVERIAEAMVTSSHFPNMPTQDWFYRAAGITPHAGEKGEGG